MRPSSEINDVILGIIGRAQRLTGVRLYGFNFQSNHSHELTGVDYVAQMADYQRLLKGNLAKKVGRYYGWEEKFWGRRYQSACLSDDEEDQKNRLRYILANGVKDGLVDSPLDWPGVSSAWVFSKGIWTMKGTWYEGLPGRSRGTHRVRVEETVQLSPLPFMENWSAERQREWFLKTIRDLEDEARDRRRSTGRRSVGVRRILRQNPHDKPQNFRPSPAPLFHASDPIERRRMMEAREAKEAAYRDARSRLRRGDVDAKFPDDCFLPPHVTRKRGPPGT